MYTTPAHGFIFASVQYADNAHNIKPTGVELLGICCLSHFLASKFIIHTHIVYFYAIFINFILYMCILL